LALHELFNTFPNLEELSVSVNWLLGGCVMDGLPSPTRILGLVLSEDATFPPLKSLSLSGYPIEGDEVALWRDRFPWEKLQSLSVGVQLLPSTPGLLELATGKLVNLKEFRITSYNRLRSSAELDAFLCSFNTLESLTAKGAVPSFSSVIHQSNLKHLCLHAIEKPDMERETLDVEQLENLNQHCPELTTLEIDLDPNGTWVSRGLISLPLLELIFVCLARRYYQCHSNLLQESSSTFHSRWTRYRSCERYIFNGGGFCASFDSIKG
jgi:hypothetical protein